MKVEELILEVRKRSDCEVRPQNGLPNITNYQMPDDLIKFYNLCGGMELHVESDYKFSIVTPNQTQNTKVIRLDHCRSSNTILFPALAELFSSPDPPTVIK